FSLRCGTSFVNDEGIATESRWGLLGTSIIGSQGYDHKILANLEIESPGQEDQKMHVDLDDLKLLAKIDPSNMVGAVDRFPDVFLRSRDELDIGDPSPPFVIATKHHSFRSKLRWLRELLLAN